MSRRCTKVLGALAVLAAPLSGAEESAQKAGPNSAQAVILQEWLADNFAVKLKNKGGQLQLAGAIAVEGAGVSEKINGNQMRGECGPCEKPNYPFTVGFTLNGSYKAPRSWAVFYLNFGNDMGIKPGQTDGISLDRAFFGYAFIDNGDQRLELNLGRRFIGDIFNSSIQFDSQLDGLDVKYADVIPKVGDFYIQGAVFLVNQLTNHWAWAAEAGLLNVAETGLYMQLSFIDWYKGGKTDLELETSIGVEDMFAVHNPRYRFMNLQPQIGYEFQIPLWGKERDINFYGAVSYNFLARPLTIQNSGKPEPYSFCNECCDCCCPPKCVNIPRAPWAGYVGVTIGDLGEPGDFLCDLHYEYVQAQSVPEFDLAGIGLGNCQKNDLYASGMGVTNYQGVAFKALYQITPHITAQTSLVYSQTIDNGIACPVEYAKGKLGFTYAF
jgi:hypothetical protein